MAKATLSNAQKNTMIAARSLDQATRKQILAAMFTGIKAQFGIPDSHRLTVEIDDASSPLYMVLVRKKAPNGEGSTNGAGYVLNYRSKWQGFFDAPVVAAPVRKWVKLTPQQLADIAAYLKVTSSNVPGANLPSYQGAPVAGSDMRVTFNNDRSVYFEINA